MAPLSASRHAFDGIQPETNTVVLGKVEELVRNRHDGRTSKPHEVR